MTTKANLAPVVKLPIDLSAVQRLTGPLTLPVPSTEPLAIYYVINGHVITLFWSPMDNFGDGVRGIKIEPV